MKLNHLNDLQAKEAAEEITALLKRCQQMQSEKDGRERPAPGAYSRDEDEFADCVLP